MLPLITVNKVLCIKLENSTVCLVGAVNHKSGVGGPACGQGAGHRGGQGNQYQWI